MDNRPGGFLQETELSNTSALVLWQ